MFESSHAMSAIRGSDALDAKPEGLAPCATPAARNIPNNVIIRAVCLTFTASAPSFYLLPHSRAKYLRLYGAVFAKLTSLAKEPDRVAHDTKLAFLSKDLNEISEHATNIAEVVMFMVDGKEIAHMDMHERRTPR